MTRLHGKPFQPEVPRRRPAAGGQPPDPPAAPRRRPGRLTARIVRKPLADIGPALLPAILLLHDRQACVLLEHLPDGGARVRFPEAGESAHDLSADELAALHRAGVVLCARASASRPARPAGASAAGQPLVLGHRRRKLAPLPRCTRLGAGRPGDQPLALAIPMFPMSSLRPRRAQPRRRHPVGAGPARCWCSASTSCCAPCAPTSSTAPASASTQPSRRASWKRCSACAWTPARLSVGAFAANLRLRGRARLHRLGHRHHPHRPALRAGRW